MSEMEPYVVRDGDHVERIARTVGCSKEEIWEHEKNQPLREDGRTEDYLVPGDVLYVPEAAPQRRVVEVEGANAYRASTGADAEAFDVHGGRLVILINKGAKSAARDEDVDAQTVKSLLTRIDGRLRGTLDDVWAGAVGVGAASDPEEAWARQISEMMLGAFYGGPSIWYGHGDDRWYYARFEASGGCYPLVVACQQLSTINLLSRGFTLAAIGAGGLNAGGSSGLGIWKQPGAAWSTDEKYRTNPSWALSASNPVAPGSVYEFYDPELGPNKGGAHIGFVLRTRRTPDRIQTFDTGGLNAPRRNESVLLNPGRTFDDPWIAIIPGPSKTPFSGIGIPPPPADLADAVKGLRRKFPLGFARLIIESRAGKTPLYTSPILRMHGGGPEDNWSIARYLWSIRDLPGAAKLRATWQFFIPRGGLTPVAADVARRGYSTHQLLLCAKQRFSRTAPTSRLNTVLWSHSNAFVEIDGSVRLQEVKAPVSGELPWDRRSGDLLSGIAEAPASVWGGPDSWGTVDGTWICVSTAGDGTSTEFKMELRQSDGVLSGTYPAGTLTDGESFDADEGTYAFQGRWQSWDGKRAGTWTFYFASDRASFDGGWSLDGSPNGGGRWDGVR